MLFSVATELGWQNYDREDDILILSIFYSLTILSYEDRGRIMRISFDLDDTLICRQAGAKYEKNLDVFLIGLWLNEPLRLGTRFLTRHLQQDGHEIWIYTSSYRQPLIVKLWLRFYGIKVVKVINRSIHDRYTKLRNGTIQSSKNPKLFDIDLHIDDSIGVQIEGDRYGFRVLVIEPNDLAWVDKVIKAVNSFRD